MGKKKNKQVSAAVADTPQHGAGKTNINKQQKQINGKEENFITQFEQRQNEKPAVSLKDDASNQKQQEENGLMSKRKEPKNLQRNDGLSAQHVPIIQLLANENGKIKKNKAMKRKLDSSDSTMSSKTDIGNDSAVAESGNGNIFESIITDKDKEDKQKHPSTKRKRIETDSDDSHLVDTKKALTKKNRIMQKNTDPDITLLDDEDSVDDEEEMEDVDDLDEMLLMDNEMEDEEEDESDLGSFIAEDEELSDEESADDYSTASTLDLNILGYTAVKESVDCLVLQADQGFSIATNAFQLHKFSSADDDHSVQVGLRALQWILSPVDTQMFFSNIFQKRILLVKRASAAYFDGFFSTESFTRILQNNFLEYGKDLNVASYENGVRHTHNPTVTGGEGVLRVTPAEIRAQLAKGRSIQCVHPQVFNDNIWYICEVLQEVFCSFVGANNYLTPAGSSGFAPHWDDIDAFMVQVEGKKYWKVYAPENADDVLPLESSGNFTDADFSARQPVFEGWLEQGDTLYVPRGFIHQAHTGADTHSHHVTISVCRRHSYADFMEGATVEFIQMLTSKSKRLRAALPPLLLDMGGSAQQQYSGQETMDTKLLPISEFIARKFGSEFSAFVPSYIDLMSREFFRTALPPLLSAEERELSCFGGADFKLLEHLPKIGPNTEVRLVRKHGQRLLFEDDDRAFIAHRMANSRRYEGNPESELDFPVELEDGYTMLADSYPQWIKVAELGLHSAELNIELAELLFSNGILLCNHSKEGEKGEVESGRKGQKMQAKGHEMEEDVVGDGEKKKRKKGKKKKTGQNDGPEATTSSAAKGQEDDDDEMGEGEEETGGDMKKKKKRKRGEKKWGKKQQ